MKIFAALKQIEFAAKLFAAAGFNFQAAVDAKDENALKAHIEQAVAAAPARTVEPTAEQIQALATSELRAQLKLGADVDPIAHLASIATAQAEFTAIKSGLTAAGVKFEKPEGFAAALEARINTRAGEELAKRGLRDFPEQVVTDDPAKAAKVQTDFKLTGRARYRADFNRQLAKLTARN